MWKSGLDCMANEKPSFAFLGCTKFSEALLLHLIEHGYVPSVIFTIPQEFDISYSKQKVKNSNYADLRSIAKEYSILVFEVESKPGSRLQDFKAEILDLNIELMLVLGWYYMIPKKVLEILSYGAWGIHASLLPKYAGGAPLTWAIINGEKETGVTLFRMDDGVDDGDVIAQRRFEIGTNDSIQEIYLKAQIESKRVLIDTLRDIDAVTFTPQDKTKIQVYPQRSPKDGEIDLNLPAAAMHNFIRAQSYPYPGAFIRTTDGKKLIIEKARVEEWKED